MKHVRRKDKLGNLLRILTDAIQLQSGLIEPVLVTRVDWTKWVEATWLGNLKEGLDQVGGELHTIFYSLKKQRQYDRSLMEIFDSWKMSDKDLQALNRCRIYLRVIFVSDISDFSGNRILEEAMNVVTFRESTYKWSKQIRPTRAERNLWKRCLKKMCIVGKELISSLGRWTSDTHQLWKFMKCKDDGTLLLSMDTVQKKMKKMGQRRYMQWGTVLDYPIKGIPIQCVTTPLGYSEIETEYDKIKYREVHSIFKHKKEAIKNTLGYVKSQNLNLLRERWTRGDEWVIGTDGGLKSGIGTCGVTLHNRSLDKELCTSMAAEECGHNHLHSTREEIKAVVAAEAIIKECNEYFGCSNQDIKFICDNRSALGAIKCDESGKFKSVDPLGPDSELLMELENIRKGNDNIRREFKWVKSHVDKDRSRCLTEDEKINQRADELATTSRKYAEEGLLKIAQKQIYEGACVTLKIKGSVVSKDIKKAIIMAMYGNDMLIYMKEKYGWTSNVTKDINWDACEAAINKTYGLQKVAVYKLMHFWQPTNSVVQRNQKRTTDKAKCTECECLDDQMHYMMCHSQFFVDSRKIAWKKFNRLMKKYFSETTMLQVMWMGIQKWVYGEDEVQLPQGTELNMVQYRALQKAYKSQSVIGWKHFLVGRVSKQWSEYYALRLEESEVKNGKVIAFGRDLVYSIWTYTLSVWENHNEAVHGKNKKYSTRDVKSIKQFVKKYIEK